MDKTQQDRTVYVRRFGRALSGSRKTALEKYQPLTALPDDFYSVGDLVSPFTLFDHQPDKIWIEIGFGSGDHLAEQMKRHPDVGFIGVEPFVNGVSTFFTLIDEALAKRVRIEMDDAVTLCEKLEPASVERIYVLNPDPWHKKKHHKRRIIRPETLDIYARILKPGAELIFSSDVEYLNEWMLCHATSHPKFCWEIGRWDDCYRTPEGWVKTRYELKGAKGAKQQAYFKFIRTDD